MIGSRPDYQIVRYQIRLGPSNDPYPFEHTAVKNGMVGVKADEDALFDALEEEMQAAVKAIIKFWRKHAA